MLAALRPLCILSLFVCGFSGFSGAVQPAAAQDLEAWNKPFEPFQVLGPIYYVGTVELGAYLITTPEGHVLIDGGLKESAPLIEQSIRLLGFKAQDIRVLLTTQAHYDHVASMAYFHRVSDARVDVMKGDAELLASGGKTDYLAQRWGPSSQFEPVKATRVLRDGDTVTLGGVTLTARATPGHTPGCTTWVTTVQDGGKSYKVVFPGSTSVNPGTRLVGQESYPGIARDFAHAFEVLASLKPDVFLAGHAGAFDLPTKRARMKAGATVNPFIDPDGYATYIAGKKADFERELAKQKAASATK
jgi:metallo-beta-lactamase class B